MNFFTVYNFLPTTGLKPKRPTEKKQETTQGQQLYDRYKGIHRYGDSFFVLLEQFPPDAVGGAGGLGSDTVKR